ncbi:PLP-dependent aminotransferase family protein [Ancylobacter sp. A5.8]|uniref:aminotransferase-like domain-containing protein n=1 Tax=Ancylobacter gelatini TaxID=2919920 RepID=UPI001F4D3B5A|nr:PLP-dependent aminotransferase family protein [Ancylobacter gelatini]MCJ8142670.1 PLP-dependent aminotransferase family protein [Ancylobacter gelatini]
MEPRLTAPPPDDWIGPLDRADRTGGPIHARIVAALEDAVARGVLRPGERLPTQRALAGRLGVDLTTVTRAYNEARHRGLIDAVTGRGSFIAGGAAFSAPAMDLSMNMPPPPHGMKLGELIERGLSGLLARSNADVLMAYHVGPGAPQDRLAAARWLEPTLGPVSTSRLMVLPGAQGALASLLSLLTRPGDTLLAERETYPGLIAAAARLGVKVAGVACDGEGLRPDALLAACHAGTARLLYLQPALQNPTTATMGAQRRAEIARIARARNLTMIEDDPYSRLMDAPLAAFATLLPEATYHVATLAKTLTPGLRTAYVAVPEGQTTDALAQAMRALALMPAPLMTALATRWISTGTATHLLGAIRHEARARQEMARALLPEGAIAAPEGLHVWQKLPAHWDRGRLTAAARRRGLAVTPADAFCVEGTPSPALRLSLGAVADRARLGEALAALAALIGGTAD